MYEMVNGSILPRQEYQKFFRWGSWNHSGTVPGKPTITIFRRINLCYHPDKIQGNEEGEGAQEPVFQVLGIKRRRTSLAKVFRPTVKLCPLDME